MDQCCGTCNEDHQCRASCDPLDHDCSDPFATGKCCLGLFCSSRAGLLGFKCKPCIPKDSSPETFVGTDTPEPFSCCSAQIDGDGKCK
jgi:hypothetical protein